MPHGTRLYSIAATRYGDNFDGKTTSLCVRRATFWDSEKNAEDPEKKGLCSNFLCDAKPGEEIKMTGQDHVLSSACCMKPGVTHSNTCNVGIDIQRLTMFCYLTSMCVRGSAEPFTYMN